MKATTALEHLSRMLNIYEAELDANPKEQAFETLEDYVNAALFMKKETGRKGDRISEALELMNNL